MLAPASIREYKVVQTTFLQTRMNGIILLISLLTVMSPFYSLVQACRFTKCNLCTLIKDQMNKLTVVHEEKMKLRELLDSYLKLQE